MLLQVKNLSIRFPGNAVDTVSGVGFEVEPGSITALVGESGCGKSISCLSLAGLLPVKPETGCALFTDRSGKTTDLLSLREKQIRRFRGGEIAYIFQEPASSLNPVLRIGEQIEEVLCLHRPDVKDYRAEVIRLLSEVGIPSPAERALAFPHELSGGMQQRVMIAMALAGNPSLLIADEPTTALDVTIQAQILEVIRQMTLQRGLGVILVTHNLGIVSNMAEQVVVMYAGQICESGPTRDIISSPHHPYTKALLQAVPRLGKRENALRGIPGRVPENNELPAGCRFCGRCALCRSLPETARKRCETASPPATEVSAQHHVFCHYPNGITS